MKTLSNTVMAGVYPVLPTPFDVAKAVDADSLRRLVRYLLRAGVDGMTFPGVASEFLQLSESERLALVQLVLDEVAGRVLDKVLHIFFAKWFLLTGIVWTI